MWPTDGPAAASCGAYGAGEPGACGGARCARRAARSSPSMHASSRHSGTGSWMQGLRTRLRLAAAHVHAPCSTCCSSCPGPHTLAPAKNRSGAQPCTVGGRTSAWFSAVRKASKEGRSQHHAR